MRISEAAALYGLAPSTLRWWEKQGVLTPPARDGGRRLYRDHDLRRIGLAYLCCVTGGMVLGDAAVVTSGTADIESWQRTVRDQITRLEEQMAKLESARAYLSGLLRCSDDDLAGCPHLDDELMTRTPRGRAADADLVAAARAATGNGDRRPRGDEEPAPAGVPSAACQSCGHPVARTSRGRPRKYCSHACQQRAYRARHATNAGARP